MSLFTNLQSKEDLARLKKKIAKDKDLQAEIERVRGSSHFTRGGTRKVGVSSLPSTAEVRQLYEDYVSRGMEEVNPNADKILRKMATKSNSGVAVVSVLTMPYACPGRCTYCPFDARMPKSYLADEPAAARALANQFDPYLQVKSRLLALSLNGHPVDKVEMIVIGGTWSFYGPNYQLDFMIGLYRACNDWGGVRDSRNDELGDKKIYLHELQKKNEEAKARIIGLSIETRPDYITDDEIARLRSFGVTKVEMGVQHLDNNVLARTKRDMTIETVVDATEKLREAGFKIVYHMMPNLPGSTIERDISMFHDLFSDPRFQPDMLKIYPCVVLEGTELFAEYKKGEYVPYDDETLGRVLAAEKKYVPPYVRIQRVVRDIPATHIVGGSKVSNFREVIKRVMKKEGWKCECIRCREVRDDVVDPEKFLLSERVYETLRGMEFFLSFESGEGNHRTLASFVRLRIPNKKGEAILPELASAALIRELHTYGQLTRIGDEGTQSQHVGFGRRLIARAEEIARESGFKKLAIISGVGVRKYYEKLGYHLEGTYMVKEIV